MDWLEIVSDDNQDMRHEFIGDLIMRNGFKVRYKEVVLYTDELRDAIKNTFASKGYEVRIKYNNTYAYCEVTAVKKKNVYGEIAMIAAVAWSIYRVYTFMMYELIAWLMVAGTHLQTLLFIAVVIAMLPLFLALDFMDVMGALSMMGIVVYVYV